MNFSFYDFSGFFSSIHEWLLGLMPEALVITIEWITIGTLAILFVALLGLSLVYGERKVAAWFQQRIGPNRVGPYGVLQTVADIVKLIMKEPLTPKSSDHFLYNLAKRFDYNAWIKHKYHNDIRNISEQDQTYYQRTYIEKIAKRIKRFFTF